MKAARWMLSALLVAGLAPLALAQSGYSANCVPPPDSEDLLRDGGYEGTWKLKMTFQQDLGGSVMVQTIQGEGSFRLRIDRFGKPGNEFEMDSDASRLEGNLSTSTVMDWGLPKGQAAQRLQGYGELKLSGKPGSKMFEGVGQHRISGQLDVKAPGWSSSRGQSFSDEFKLQFMATQGDCHGARGQLYSPSLDDMERTMREAGFTVQREDCTWSMTRVEDLSDPIRWLKEELAKKGPGDTADRQAEARRLSAIAERIKKYPKDTVGCLAPLWRDHVTKVYWEWVERDGANLQAYQGEWPGLAQLANQGLDTTRAICLIGIDTCAEAAQRRIWRALEDAFTRHLQRMIQGGTSLARMVDLLRQAELYGVVSPPLREQCTAVVQKLAKQEADAAYKALLAAFAAAGQNVQAPEVQKALALSKRAEKVAAMHDVPTNQTEAWEQAHPATPQ